MSTDGIKISPCIFLNAKNASSQSLSDSLTSLIMESTLECTDSVVIVAGSLFLDVKEHYWTVLFIFVKRYAISGKWLSLFAKVAVKSESVLIASSTLVFKLSTTE